MQAKEMHECVTNTSLRAGQLPASFWLLVKPHKTVDKLKGLRESDFLRTEEVDRGRGVRLGLWPDEDVPHTVRVIA